MIRVDKTTFEITSSNSIPSLSSFFIDKNKFIDSISFETSELMAPIICLLNRMGYYTRESHCGEFITANYELKYGKYAIKDNIPVGKFNTIDSDNSAYLICRNNDEVILTNTPSILFVYSIGDFDWKDDMIDPLICEKDCLWDEYYTEVTAEMDDSGKLSYKYSNKMRMYLDLDPDEHICSINLVLNMQEFYKKYNTEGLDELESYYVLYQGLMNECRWLYNIFKENLVPREN